MYGCTSRSWPCRQAPQTRETCVPYVGGRACNLAAPPPYQPQWSSHAVPVHHYHSAVWAPGESAPTPPCLPSLFCGCAGMQYWVTSTTACAPSCCPSWPLSPFPCWREPWERVPLCLSCRRWPKVCGALQGCACDCVVCGCVPASCARHGVQEVLLALMHGACVLDGVVIQYFAGGSLWALRSWPAAQWATTHSC